VPPANNKPFGRLAAFGIIAEQLSKGVGLEPRPLAPEVASAAEKLLGIRLPTGNDRGH
jgi:AMP-polyphosphate phosphotransferase